MRIRQNGNISYYFKDKTAKKRKIRASKLGSYYSKDKVNEAIQLNVTTLENDKSDKDPLEVYDQPVDDIEELFKDEFKQSKEVETEEVEEKEEIEQEEPLEPRSTGILEDLKKQQKANYIPSAWKDEDLDEVVEDIDKQKQVVSEYEASLEYKILKALEEKKSAQHN